MQKSMVGLSQFAGHAMPVHSAASLYIPLKRQGYRAFSVLLHLWGSEHYITEILPNKKYFPRKHNGRNISGKVKRITKSAS